MCFPFRITDIKYNSPAHTSGKIEDGDEIVQINYQTVIGWQYKKVIHQLQESGPDILLTLKKRPKHTKIYGQIYMKPYRLPSKKKTLPYLFDNLPSPRVDFFPSQHFPMPQPLARVPEKNMSDDSDSSCSDILTPTEPTKVPEKELRLYLPKPRAVLQRRNTICGDRASGFKGNVVFWHEHRGRIEQDSPSLRDKSVSFGFGLEMTARPTTCIGIQNANAPIPRFSDFNSNQCKKGSLPEMNGKNVVEEKHSNASVAVGPGADEESPPVVVSVSKPGISKVVRFDANMKEECGRVDDKFTCKIDTTIVETFEPIPYVDEEDVPPPVYRKESISSVVEKIGRNGNAAVPPVPTKPILHETTGLAEAVNEVLLKREQNRRAAFKKSASAPTYDQDSDNDGSDDSDSGKEKVVHYYVSSNRTYLFTISYLCFPDVPPAIEPRIIAKTPPAVPPRPRKSIDSSPLSANTTLSQQTPPPIVAKPNKPANIVIPTELHFDENSNKSKMATVIDLKRRDAPIPAPIAISKSISTDSFVQKTIPATKHFLEDCFEELELLTPPKTKNLTLKKKNSMLAKRRKISLKTLEVSDIQGHLYRRTKDKHGVTYWAKLYVVLVDTALYGFQTKESSKAHCLIFLPGFTVSTATEVHSKPFAFKVYHPMKTFYFAAESQQALAQWMEYIKRATIKGNMVTVGLEMDHNIKDLYSETESSDEDLDLGTSKFYSPLLTAKSGTNLHLLGGSGKKHTSEESISTPKSEKYHLGFGSLKKFTRNNLPFTNRSHKEDKDKKEKNSDVPVPTAQFRSYRKVPGNAGMQLGTTSMFNADFLTSMTSNPFENANHVMYPVPEASPRKNSVSSMGSASVSMPPSTPVPVPSTPTQIPIANPPHSSPVISSPVISSSATSSPATSSPIPIPAPLPITPSPIPINHQPDLIQSESPPKPMPLRDIRKAKSRAPKATPYNYIHASNPNLVEFTFQTSKTLDYSFPKISVGTPHSLQGFVTLKDLMLQKQEEERQEMYNKRVLLGVEKNNEKLNRRMMHPSDDDENAYKPSYNKIQSRSLPKTPDYAQSFKPDDSDIIMARTKEGQKLRDFGYEFISSDDATPSTHKHKANISKEMNAKLKDRDRLMIAAIGAGNSVSVSKKKALNWMSSSGDSKKTDDDKSRSGGSFKKARSKIVAETLENFKSSSEKLFQFKYGHNHNNDKEAINQHKNPVDKAAPLKPVTSYSPMTLPLNRKTSNNLTANGQQHAPSTSGLQLKKSQTSNLHDFRENYSTVERKNSAPIERSASYFTKLSFSSNKTAKEKKLLGSPRLHRAIFGRRDPDHHPPIDHEVFSPIEHVEVPKVSAPLPPLATPARSSDVSDAAAHSFYGSSAGGSSRFMPSKTSSSSSGPSIATTDYPNLEYPPVFEPETYSLCDPNSSLTLLRRRNPNGQQNAK